MKETIQRLQTLADRAYKYNYPEDSNMGVRISDIRAVLEFCEKTANFSEYTEQEINCKGCMGPCGQCKDEQPNAPGIRPDWRSLDEKFQWVAIDESGEEHAYRAKPKINEIRGFWYNVRGGTGTGFVSTNRFFGMSGIDWTKTLSKRPAK